jgi:hypothetical protein
MKPAAGCANTRGPTPQHAAYRPRSGGMGIPLVQPTAPREMPHEVEAKSDQEGLQDEVDVQDHSKTSMAPRRTAGGALS